MALSQEQVAFRNQKIREAGGATRSRRKALEARTMSLKIAADKLTQEQKTALQQLFLQTKWLRNAILADGDFSGYDLKANTVTVLTPSGPAERPLTLGSHLRQTVRDELVWNLSSLAALKAKGHGVGRLKFVSSVDSIHLKQVGITYKLNGSKAKVQSVPGWLRVHGIKQFDDRELASAKLVRRPSGYYLLVTTYGPKRGAGNLSVVGIDMGVSTHLTLSDGREYNCLVPESLRLKRYQRKMARQRAVHARKLAAQRAAGVKAHKEQDARGYRSGKNYAKSRQVVLREYEKLDRRKEEMANQIVSSLRQHEAVFYQDENLRGWKIRYGKQVHHSVLGRLKNRLSHVDQAVMLDRWLATTQWCPKCGAMNKIPLSQRVYSCVCGYTCPRDVHAARNMVILGQKLPEELIALGFKLRLPQELGQGDTNAPTPVTAMVLKEDLATVAHRGRKPSPSKQVTLGPKRPPGERAVLSPETPGSSVPV